MIYSLRTMDHQDSKVSKEIIVGILKSPCISPIASSRQNLSQIFVLTFKKLNFIYVPVFFETKIFFNHRKLISLLIKLIVWQSIPYKFGDMTIETNFLFTSHKALIFIRQNTTKYFKTSSIVIFLNIVIATDNLTHKYYIENSPIFTLLYLYVYYILIYKLGTINQIFQIWV